METRADRVDLNADLGEEVTDDEGLLAVVTSANVACGFHAGSSATMRRVCELAADRGVVVGAQVSYADRENFGRVELDVPASVLAEQVAEQVGLLQAAASIAGLTVSYVKPHGALYHRAGRDHEQASAVLRGAVGLPVLGMPGAVLLDLAREEGRSVRHEGFPDRAYTADGGLVPRSEPGAVLDDPGSIADRAAELAGLVDSLCLHGDTPGAVAHAVAVRRRLESAGWVLQECWSAT